MKDRGNVKYLMKKRRFLHKFLPVSIIFLMFLGIFHLNLRCNFDMEESLSILNQADPQSPHSAYSNHDWNVTWGIGGSDYGLGIYNDSMGNLYVSGYTTSYGMNGEAVIIKYDADGVQLWSRTWGGSSSDYGADIAVDSAGMIYLSGYTSSFGVGNYDMFIAKFDETGSALWNTTWGGSAADYCYGIAVRMDGSVFITGLTYSFGKTSGDAFTARYGEDGTRIWNRTWGGSNLDQGYDVIINPTGCPCIVGHTNSYGAGNYDGFVLIYNDNGELNWSRTWGGNNLEYGYGLISNSNGSIYLTGQTQSYGTPGNNMFLAYICGDLKCNQPTDQIFQVGTTGNVISWTPFDLSVSTTSYTVFKNGTSFSSGIWALNTAIIVNLDTLPTGLFNLTILLSDGLGQSITDEAWIEVRNRYVSGYALIIGINDYPGTDLDLMYPVADANSIENMLTGVGFPAENIEKLTDSAATKSNIIAKINAIRQKATRNDLFVMYYSGHGDRQVDQSTEKTCSYSTTHNYPNNYDVHWTIHEEGALAIRVQFSNFNTEAENDLGFVSDPELYADGYGIVYSGNLGTFWSDWMLGDTLIVGMVSNEYRTYYGFDVKKYEIATGFDSTIVNQDFESVGEFMGRDLDSYLDALPCLNQYYFFDSCMSGGLIDDLAQRGRTISTACTDEEISWETSELGHGVFTYYLLQVFNKNAGNYVHDLNGDKQIDVVEMFNWTEPNTITKSGQLGEVQHPQFYNNPIGCGLWNFTLLNIDADGDRLCDWG